MATRRDSALSPILLTIKIPNKAKKRRRSAQFDRSSF
jgi:hypothetical protein